MSHTSDWNYFLRALIRYVSRGDDYTRRFYPHEEFLSLRNTYIRVERSLMMPLCSLGPRNEEMATSSDASLMLCNSILQGRIERSNLHLRLNQSNRLTVRIRGEKFLLSIARCCRRRQVKFTRTKLVSRSLITLHQILITKARRRRTSAISASSFHVERFTRGQHRLE